MFKLVSGATGMPKSGDTIYVYETGTTTIVQNLSTGGASPTPLSNPFTVPATGISYGFEPANADRVDVYWFEADKNIITDINARDTYLDINIFTQLAKAVSYELTTNDIGKHLLHPSTHTDPVTFTIPSYTTLDFPIGTVLTIINQNGAGTVLIAITTDIMRLAGVGTTGTRNLAANGIASVLKIAQDEWIISGTGLS